MSKAARIKHYKQTGLVWRDGGYVDEKEWGAAHKTKSQVKQDAAAFVKSFKKEKGATT